MSISKLSQTEIDLLREIGNIGAGNAATSMSAIINQRVEMSLPTVNIVTFDEIMEIVGGPDQLIVAMFFRIHGPAPGTLYFILSIEEAAFLVNEMTGGSISLDLSATNEEPSEIAVSALKEIGNIIIGSYLTALSDFININMQSSIPYLGVDMAGAILTAGLIEVSQDSDHAIVIDAKINDEKEKGMFGHFFLIPDPDSITKIFSSLGITNHD